MSIAVIICGVLAALIVGYFTYGRYLARQYRLDDGVDTPATRIDDGMDFIPTRPAYLLGQHFSAIAAAGPIAGPILACSQFGWLPCILWIVFGVIFIGAVHDFSALVASVRHGATSVAELAKLYLGRRAWLALLVFIWIALVYVIVAFTQITADSFAGRAEELEGLATTFNRGGAVAAASVFYLALSLVLGVVQRFLAPPLWLLAAIFVPATLLCVWGATHADEWLNLGAQTWFVLILVYCLVAAMLPMWLLQQPRGFLGGSVLYLAIGVGVVGVLVGGFEVQQPALTERALESLNPLHFLALGDAAPPPLTGYLFPFLFVTIACGACSGFHGLICGGTTSKQIARESHCRPVGYGAMLLEGFVAVLALATIMMLTPEQTLGPDGRPLSAARIYGNGLALFLSALLGEDWLLFAATFGAMAFSTFVFDTLDVTTRLGRYLLVELLNSFRARSTESTFLTGAAASLVTVCVPLGFLLLSDPKGYAQFWTLFGTSNQLLAALTLVAVTVWLRKEGRRAWYTFVPMVAVLGVTLAALGLQIAVGLRDFARMGAWTPAGALNPAVLNAAVATALLALATVFAWEGHFASRGGGAPRASGGAGAAPR
jgi:carbon starvation protein